VTQGWRTERVEPERIGDPRPSGGGSKQRRPVGRPAAGRRRLALVLIFAVFAGAVVAGVAYPLRHHLGFGPPDFHAGEAGPSVLVRLQGTTNSDFANDLVGAGVVKSAGAFNKAAADHPMSAGFYDLPTKLPAAQAVTLITDPQRSHRVGMLNVTPGTQLDDRSNKAGEVAKGVFTLLSEATAHIVGGKKTQIPAATFAQVAATGTVVDLGVPEWAAPTVERLKGDHRRIEGLIAPGVWDQIDPNAEPVDILKQLISDSAARYEAQGLLEASVTSPARLTPYQVLVSASIVEREVSLPDDYSKVARVILNRLAKDQRLEMDSTVNFTEAVTGIDVVGEQLMKKTEWNTYMKKGLPATPIGSVGDSALQATEAPAPGDWLYFVTVDSQGTTLFTADFAQHEKNRQRACDTKFLTTGCK
jgi:UPF0755 protein